MGGRHFIPDDNPENIEASIPLSKQFRHDSSTSSLNSTSRRKSRLMASRTNQTLMFVIVICVLLGYLTYSVYMSSMQTPFALFSYWDYSGKFVHNTYTTVSIRRDLLRPTIPTDTSSSTTPATSNSRATNNNIDENVAHPVSTSARPRFTGSQFAETAQLVHKRGAIHNGHSNPADYPVTDDLTICGEGLLDTRLYIQNKPRSAYANLPTIYFVTPTYPRQEQAAELTRLANTLLHVPRLHWIIANDLTHCDKYLDEFLERIGLPYTHLSSPMPAHYHKMTTLPRGVSNRRAAMKWLRRHNDTDGVMYFGDDDNTYDTRLFDEIRYTKHVSMFPVGFFDKVGVVGPIVKKGKVVGFVGSWVGDRYFAVDMAGFAVHTSLMEHATMPYKPGQEEEGFLKSLNLKFEDIEVKANNCTEIYVWHTQTKNHKQCLVRLAHEYMDNRTNLGPLLKRMKLLGITRTSETEGQPLAVSRFGKIKPAASFFN